MPTKPAALLDPDNRPEGYFAPKHKLFRGKATVAPHDFATDEPPFTVDLTKGECTCPSGKAYYWYTEPGKALWVPNKYCVHKLKAIADIVQSKGLEQDEEVFFAFIQCVATRYNQYEVVSAFTKELRRGNVERAWFFGCILAAGRRIKGVLKWMLAIVYEETRDHDLRDYLYTKITTEDFNLLSMAHCIEWFCTTKKKWDLHEHRVKLYEHEQRGYRKLVEEFGPDVAKAQEIIDESMVQVFWDGMLPALKRKDYDTFQYCIKGIQKSKFPDGINNLHELRLATVKRLRHGPDGFKIAGKENENIKNFFSYLIGKDPKVGISYHDLNAFADMLSGEPYDYGTLPERQQRAIKRKRELPAFPFTKFPNIPLYAHDNHTFRGKALLRTYAGQAHPGVEQTEIDLRGCGAYLGVGWRLYAMQQHGSIRVKWHEVKFPKWLIKHLDDMWY